MEEVLMLSTPRYMFDLMFQRDVTTAFEEEVRSNACSE